MKNIREFIKLLTIGSAATILPRNLCGSGIVIPKGKGHSSLASVQTSTRTSFMMQGNRNLTESFTRGWTTIWDGRFHLYGRKTKFVGPSPEDLGVDMSTFGYPIVPRITDRTL